MRTRIESSTEARRSTKNVGRALLRFVSPLAMSAALLSATSASASEPERPANRFEFTPFAGYMVGGEFEDPTTNAERDLDEGSSYGLFVDIAAEDWRHYEILFTDLDSEVDGTAPFDMGVQYVQIGGTVNYPDARYVIPYFGMTIGAARFSPDQAGLDDETKFAFSAGGGLKIPITDHFGVRLDARAFVTVLDSEGDLFCASDATGGTCAIRAKSDTFLQYAASLGVTIGF
jgi:opacity protein-like surface antigen